MENPLNETSVTCWQCNEIHSDWDVAEDQYGNLNLWCKKCEARALAVRRLRDRDLWIAETWNTLKLAVSMGLIVGIGLLIILRLAR